MQRSSKRRAAAPDGNSRYIAELGASPQRVRARAGAEQHQVQRSSRHSEEAGAEPRELAGRGPSGESMMAIDAAPFPEQHCVSGAQQVTEHNMSRCRAPNLYQRRNALPADRHPKGSASPVQTSRPAKDCQQQTAKTCLWTVHGACGWSIIRFLQCLIYIPAYEEVHGSQTGHAGGPPRAALTLAAPACEFETK